MTSCFLPKGEISYCGTQIPVHMDFIDLFTFLSEFCASSALNYSQFLKQIINHISITSRLSPDHPLHLEPSYLLFHPMPCLL